MIKRRTEAKDEPRYSGHTNFSDFLVSSDFLDKESLGLRSVLRFFDGYNNFGFAVSGSPNFPKSTLSDLPL